MFRAILFPVPLLLLDQVSNVPDWLHNNTVHDLLLLAIRSERRLAVSLVHKVYTRLVISLGALA